MAKKEKNIKKRPGPHRTSINLEGRNVVLEAFRAGRKITKILIDEGARETGKFEELIGLAKEHGVPIQPLARHELDRISETSSHQGVIAVASPYDSPSLTELLRGVIAQENLCIVILGEVMYEQNLGAIMRTCDGAGVNGIVIPTRRSAPLSPAVYRVAMGAGEYVPVIRESATSSLSILRREGVTIFGVEADGDKSYFDADLTGRVAFVFGGEDKSLSRTLRERCDTILSIPQRGKINSLNISVSVGIILYEKVRQEIGR